MQRLVVVLFLFSGCAFALAGPEPDRPRTQMPRCDTGKGLVVLDGLMATGTGLIGIALLSETEPAVALLPLAISAIYIGSASRGNRNVNECRAAMDDFSSMTAARETLDGMEPPRFDPDDETLPEARRTPRAAPEPVADEQPNVVSAAAPPAAPPVPAPVAPVTQQPRAQPRPATKHVAKQPVAAPPQQPSDAGNEEWSDFWREVP